jgi:hypothetical protein
MVSPGEEEKIENLPLPLEVHGAPVVGLWEGNFWEDFFFLIFWMCSWNSDENRE